MRVGAGERAVLCAVALFSAMAAGWWLRKELAQPRVQYVYLERRAPAPLKPTFNIPCPELREICKVRSRMESIKPTEKAR